MNHRFLVSVSGLTILIAVVLLATLPAAGQAPSAAARANRTTTAKAYTPARTPDGQPDLQGFWTNSTYTPLERPKDVTKEFYTKEEAAEIVKRAAERESEQTEPGTIADVHYDFTQFGLDRNQSKFAENLRTSLIVDPPNGRIPPLTAEGQKRAAERAEAAKRVGRWDSAQSNDLDDRCLIMVGAGPPMLNTGYNSNYQIVQAPGYVMILVEMIHDVRIIPLDGRPHVSQNIRQWMGDARGHWEGDTLVVETTNFNGKNPLRGSSENMRVMERFTRVDADTILYKFTVEDESTWTRTWSAELPMKKTVGPLFEHACHEGNYGLYNTLVGARLEEKRAAEEAAKKGSK
ncbi:MAG: hypothetical protein DMG12_07515 [Acidobacteria bacterium]|nr:MAG: hypothetical protein DMG12_07515 [Acidobacteriota bacterium]